jgi:hypothetical protein
MLSLEITANKIDAKAILQNSHSATNLTLNN